VRSADEEENKKQENDSLHILFAFDDSVVPKMKIIIST
jgi:hypothetical protein